MIGWPFGVSKSQTSYTRKGKSIKLALFYKQVYSTLYWSKNSLNPIPARGGVNICPPIDISILLKKIFKQTLSNILCKFLLFYHGFDAKKFFLVSLLVLPLGGVRTPIIAHFFKFEKKKFRYVGHVGYQFLLIWPWGVRIWNYHFSTPGWERVKETALN